MAIPFSLQSCKEEIDDSAFAIKTESTIADFLHSDSRFNEITEIFTNVPLSPFKGDEGQASPIISVLSARGHYTVFLPTNETVNRYAVEHGYESSSDMPLELQKLLAYSCVIDNGYDDAYESTMFPVDGSAFILPDLSDRLITCEKVDDEFHLNGTTVIRNKKGETDIKLSNGYAHIIAEDSNPIAPSNKSVADLMEVAKNMSCMSYLLRLTGWHDAMSIETADIDMEYERMPREQYLNINQLARFTIAPHRYLGYTAFVESDDVFANDLQVDVNDKEAFLEKLTTIAEEAYGVAERGNYTHPDNAINQFVAYHLLNSKVSYNNLVRHMNEVGYMYKDFKNPQTERLSVDVWDYYSTVGNHPAMLKIMQEGEMPVRETSHGIYINRINTYNTLNYETLSNVHPGIRVEAYNRSEDGGNYDNNAKNGFYYPISHILINNAATKDALSSERIRFDITTILPELMSNNVRGGVYTHFPKGYFDNITNESSQTKLLYLNAAAVNGTNWVDYQGDEFMACGVFDFILKLPRVPKSGNYELRMAVNHNKLRGMAQLYIGTDPNNLKPAGLPYDMRQDMTGNDNIGYVEDGNDDAVNIDNEKNMRNHGFMKGPRYFTNPDGKGDGQSARILRSSVMGLLRRILVQQYFDENQTYYIRFKSALEKDDAQFWIDFFEFCPSSVYNGEKAEDQW